MNTLWEFLESVFEFFLPQTILESSLYTNLLLPISEIIFGFYMIYFMIFKPIQYLFNLIGGLPKEL